MKRSKDELIDFLLKLHDGMEEDNIPIAVVCLRHVREAANRLFGGVSAKEMCAVTGIAEEECQRLLKTLKG